jgi:hypothetical protein
MLKGDLKTGIDISAGGTGLAAILGLGSVILAIQKNSDWDIFLVTSILVFAFSVIMRSFK